MTAAAITGQAVTRIQRRCVRTLVTSQVLGGAGVASGVAVGALLASRVLGRPDLAGLVQTAQVLGAALLALPAARLAVVRGRRWGVGGGYAVALVGGVGVVVAAQARSFPLLLAGMALFGGGTAAGLQARYAATDLAPAGHRGRALSVVVWSTTVGAVAGPNLVGPAGSLASALRLEPLAGPFLVAAATMGLAALAVSLGLRPDPLLLARELEAAAESPGNRDVPPGSDPGPPPRRRGVLRDGLRAASGSPPAMLGVAAVSVGHTVMIAVMVMTPVHMDSGGASLQVIGVVISLHVAGMYALSPVLGWLADRTGAAPVIVGGGLALLASLVLAGTAPAGFTAGLSAGLFLLGLGWSACLVAGSVLVTESLPVSARPAAQGASDLLMGLAAAAGGAVAGVVVGAHGYGVLNAGAALPVLALLAAAAHPACRIASNTRSG